MERELRNELVQYGCKMLDAGLITGTWGNLSARSRAVMVITPSGIGYRSLQTDDIPVVDIESGALLLKGKGSPSSELALHQAIYQARPDIKAIIHTHSVYATACAVSRMAILPIVEDLAALTGGTVEVADYAPAGSEQLAKNAVIALGKNNAVLLANHGAVGCGTNLHEAMIACQLIEKTAKIFINAHSLPGEIKCIPSADVERLHDFYVSKYRQR